MTSSRRDWDEAIEEAGGVIACSHHVAMVGAGLSVENGIPPFGGEGGLWTRVGDPDMSGYQRFLDDMETHWLNLLNPETE